VPSLVLACLAYLTIALPASTLGLLWPSMQHSFHEPVGALGILLIPGTVASVLSSAATGRLLSRRPMGPLLPLGTVLVGLAVGVEAIAPSLWVVTVGTVLFGFGFGAIDSALNAHAANHFGPRDITWMHASYGLGATIGPLLVTVLLGNGLGWRRTYGAMAVALAVLAVVFLLTRQSWAAPALPVAGDVVPRSAEPSGQPGRSRPSAAITTTALVFAAIETGIESAAGVWGYVFLTAGRGLSHDSAGVAVSAYWAMMFVGRAALGPVAERVGSPRVLAAAVAAVTVGAALMAAPGPGVVAVIGVMILGLAAAPIFPLLTLATARRAGGGSAMDVTRTASLQVAASTVGSAALPAGLGLLIEGLDARSLAPSLLVLALVMSATYGLLTRLTGPTRGTRLR
jgi:fucose permease